MADRVHPRDSPFHNETAPLSQASSPQSARRRPSPLDSEMPIPPTAGTYFIQIPKDQVYRVPPPENAIRYQSYTRTNPRRSSCRSCFCWLFAVIASVIVLSAAAGGIFYLVVRPESPNYSVESFAFKRFNLTTPSTSTAISPEIRVAVRTENPNKRIGIYYERDSSVNIFYSEIKLCDGALPAFYQPSKNVTKFQTALTGPVIKLASAVQQGLVDAQKQGKVPLELDLRLPIRIKVGSIKTWTITVKVGCHLTVDKLTVEAKIVSKDCDYSVDLW